jgi:hypothetical protein
MTPEGQGGAPCRVNPYTECQVSPRGPHEVDFVRDHAYKNMGTNEASEKITVLHPLLSCPVVFAALALSSAGCTVPEKTKFACDEEFPCWHPGRPPGSREQVRAAVGEPDKIELGGGIERWSYRSEPRRGRSWQVLVAVPYSGVVGLRHEWVTVEFDGDRVRGIEVEY